MKLNQQSDQQSDIVRRLHCAAGHLNAVIKMAEASEPCEQVIQQLAAVDAALRAAGAKMILCQAQSSQAVILESPSLRQRSAELKRLQSLYTILMKSPNHYIEVSHD
jgi:DNA-binding FrmR family transcriptional regulator